MSKPLQPLSISAPGFFGLNKQVNAITLPPGWATELENAVFDDAGRMAARKGKTNFTSDTAAGTIKQLFEYVENDGTKTLIAAGGQTIYDITLGNFTTDISPTTISSSNDNWKFVNFNGTCVATQAGDDFIRYTGTGTFTNLTLSGSLQPDSSVDEILGAYGRVWALDNSDGTLKYCDLLDPTTWASQFDLNTVWDDVGVALADFNGHLVVFGKRSILVYNNPWSPDGANNFDQAAMTLVERIEGVGCIARDSVQDIGTDILFLSSSGVRSLGRTIQEKSGKISDLSKNNRDYLLSFVFAETPEDIRSTYSPLEGFYILSMPGQNKTFYFDVRQPLQDNSARTAEWDLAPSALLTVEAGITYLENATKVAKYLGNTDAGVDYTFKYLGPWLDFSTPENDKPAAFLKIAKSLGFVINGALGQTVIVKWAFDYSDVFTARNISITSGTIAKYGLAQYGLSQYSGGLELRNIKEPMSGFGQVIQFGFEAPVAGDPFNIQRIELRAKAGRQV